MSGESRALQAIEQTIRADQRLPREVSAAALRAAAASGGDARSARNIVHEDVSLSGSERAQALRALNRAFTAARGRRHVQARARQRAPAAARVPASFIAASVLPSPVLALPGFAQGRKRARAEYAPEEYTFNPLPQIPFHFLQPGRKRAQKRANKRAAPVSNFAQRLDAMNLVALEPPEEHLRRLPPPVQPVLNLALDIADPVADLELPAAASVAMPRIRAETRRPRSQSLIARAVAGAQAAIRAITGTQAPPALPALETLPMDIVEQSGPVQVRARAPRRAEAILPAVARPTARQIREERALRVQQGLPAREFQQPGLSPAQIAEQMYGAEVPPNLAPAGEALREARAIRLEERRELLPIEDIRLRDAAILAQRRARRRAELERVEVLPQEPPGGVGGALQVVVPPPAPPIRHVRRQAAGRGFFGEALQRARERLRPAPAPPPPPIGGAPGVGFFNIPAFPLVVAPKSKAKKLPYREARKIWRRRVEANPRAAYQDYRRTAKHKTKSTAWAQHPGRYDYPGIDMPRNKRKPMDWKQFIGHYGLKGTPWRH